MTSTLPARWLLPKHHVLVTRRAMPRRTSCYQPKGPDADARAMPQPVSSAPLRRRAALERALADSLPDGGHELMKALGLRLPPDLRERFEKRTTQPFTQFELDTSPVCSPIADVCFGAAQQPTSLGRFAAEAPGRQ